MRERGTRNVTRRGIGLAAVLLALSAGPPRLASAEPAAQEKAAAEALFQQGVAHIEAGETAKGCEKLRASQTLDPAVGTALRLGDCYERLGRTASAWAMFAEAASIAEREGQAARQQAAELRASALAPQLSTLTVTVEPPVPEGLEVLRDGVALPQAVWATAVPLDPGPHVIEAAAPGHEPWTKQVELGTSASALVVTVPVLTKRPASTGTSGRAPASSPTVAAPVAPSAAGPSSDETDGTPILVSGLLIGGLGLAGVVAGAVLGLMADSSNDESMAYCRTETFCSDEGIALRETAQAEATGATVGFVAGGALLAAGLALVIAAPSGPSDAPEGAPSGRWRLEPHLGLEGAGLGLATRW